MSQLYTRVMTSFYTHRKTVKLKIALGPDAYWIPPRLWAYAAENQPDGNLSAYSSEELAELLGCPKYAASILQALKTCGFIDENGFIHDWGIHNGYHEKFSSRAKLAAAARWSKTPPAPPETESGKGKGERGASIAQASAKHATSIKFVKPELYEIVNHCLELKLPESDATWFFHKCEGNGWTNGGRPIKNWKSTITSWKAAGYMASQKGAASKPKIIHHLTDATYDSSKDII